MTMSRWPKAYRQKFGDHKRPLHKLMLSSRRKKGTLFDKWRTACKATHFSSLCELLLEKYKNCLPECIVVYLNEQRVSSLFAASVLADEYVLTRKPVFQSVCEKPHAPLLPHKNLITCQVL